jgi:hypothetical protein
VLWHPDCMDAIAEAAGESLAEGTSAAGPADSSRAGPFAFITSALRGFGRRRGRFIWGRFSFRFGRVGLEIHGGFRRVEPRRRRAHGSGRGAWGYRSPSMAPRIAAVTAATSSSGKSTVGTARI